MPRKPKTAISAPSTDPDSRTDVQGDVERNAGTPSVQEQGKGMLKSGVSASDAAKKRWEQQRARDSERATLTNLDLEDVRFVSVPIPVGRIMAKYSGEAEKGNVQAGRELRSWLEKYPATEASTDVAALDKRDRDRLVARLMLELEREEGQSPSVVPA